MDTMNIDELSDEELDKIMNDEKIVNNVRKIIKCPECNTDDFLVDDYQQGNVVCNKCGTIVSKLMSDNIETKIYEDKDGNYKSMPTNVMLPQSSLGTTIQGRRSRLKMIQRWNSMPSRERSLNEIFKEIQYRCEKAGILKCIEQDAKIMYRMLNEQKGGKKNVITRGINRIGLIAACIFIACRKKGLTRSLTEICNLFEIEYTQMTRGCKIFLKLMNIQKLNIETGTSTSEQFIKRYGDILKLPIFVSEHALKIFQNINKFNIASSHTPISIAMACILLSAEINNVSDIDKRLLSEMFNISDVTITKTYNKIKKFEKIILDDSLFEQSLKEQQRQNIEVPDFVKEKLKKINSDIELSKSKSYSDFDINKEYSKIVKLYKETF